MSPVKFKELLQLGEVIEIKPNNKYQYTYFNEDGERFRAIVGRNKDGETIICYYSNRRGGSHNAQPSPTPNKEIIPHVKRISFVVFIRTILI